MKKGFSVHKYVVSNNRKGFYLWTIKSGKHELFESISKEWASLDSFPGDRIPLEIVSNEINKMATLANEPNLGLEVIASGDVTQSPLYNVMSISLGPILNRNISLPFIFIVRLVVHYFKILTEVVSIELQENQDKISLIFKPNLPEIFSYHQIEGAMFGVARLIAKLKKYWPHQIEFQHKPQPVNLNIYLKTFRGYPLFEKQDNKLIYNATAYTALDVSIFINPFINSIENQFPEVSYKEKISLILCTTLGVLTPNIKHIAMSMNLSVKTLQRRLKDEDTSFNEILLEERKKRVIEYLKTQQFTSQHMSTLLGYKAKSQFLKAFQTWFGMTPKEYKTRFLNPVL